MTRVGMHEAKTRLSELVRLAEEGEEVVIERRGTPVARLVPEPKRKNNLASIEGALKGQIWMADDFDELPDDIAEAFGMR
jgi:prevent-host-death family protein